jgi:hypothetical protein
MPRLVSALTLTLLLLPAAAAADSDGYYCAGPGYLAYETSFSWSPGAHLLHIVRFSRARGIERLPAIPLDDFQVHGMRCHATVVELEGWTSAYSVDLSDPARPTVTSRPTVRAAAQSAPAANLGHWARESVIDLEGDGPPGEFQLVIARTSRAIEGGVEHYTFTQVVRRDRESGAPGILGSVRLFEDVFLETVD